MIPILAAGSGNDAKNAFALFLKNNAFFICLGIVLIIVICILLFTVFNKNNRD